MVDPRRLGPGPLLCAPLIGRDRVIGVITWVGPATRHSFESRHVDLMTQLARRVARALDNAMLHAQITRRERATRDVLDSLSLPLGVLDSRGTMVVTNRAWTQASAIGTDHTWCPPVEHNYLVGLKQAALRGVAHAREAGDGVRAVLNRERQRYTQEYAHRTADGVRWFLMSASPLTHSGGAVVSHDDITWPKQTADELKMRAAQQASVAQLGVEALHEADPRKLFRSAVAHVANVLRVGHVEILEAESDPPALRLVEGVGWKEGLIGSLKVSAALGSQGGYTLQAGRPVTVTDLSQEMRFTPSSLLTDHDLHSGVSVVIPGHLEPYGVLGAFSQKRRQFTQDDILFLRAVAAVLGGAVQRQNVENAILHQALHDPLTDLPNRTLLRDRLEHALAGSARTGLRVAVLFIDLDDFKTINDSLGHDAGDQLLVGLVPRLLQAVRPQDTVARFAGDEFVVLCDGIEDTKDVEGIAERLLGAFAAPFNLAGRTVHASASIGIASATADETTADELLRSADAAMYKAKSRGRARHELFEEELQSVAAHRLDIATALRHAIGRDELRVHYQPIVSLGTGQMVGVEALLRWTHPTLGPISPEEFIPVAEDTGLILPIGGWVLQQACAQLVQWDGRVPGTFTVYVNLSARQFTDPTLVDLVADTIERTSGASRMAHRIGLELTESHLQDDPEAALVTLQTLKDLGVCLAMDDFGTGYSSLSLLKNMPIDVLKIDRSFVDGLGADRHDSAITAAVIAMARALGIGVTAEGVETSVQLDALIDLGCDSAQGYYFHRPVDPAEISVELAARSDHQTAH